MPVAIVKFTRTKISKIANCWHMVLTFDSNYFQDVGILCPAVILRVSGANPMTVKKVRKLEILKIDLKQENCGRLGGFITFF